MTLLDRFRTQARDKHPDPAVRLAFVDELPLDEPETIAAMAREDEDPRVRRAAVAKLMAPAVLASIARDDGDETVRAQALAMLRDIALEAFEDVGEAQSLEAVDAIGDPRALAQIAKSSTRETVALRAIARVQDARGLGSAARHAGVESARKAALEALGARADHAEILAVALNGDFKDTAVAATETISARADLELIIARGKNKSAVKRARVIVREMDERDAREAAEAAAALAAAAIDATPAVLEPIEEIASPPHGDPLAGQLDTESDRARREELAQQEAEAAAERARLAAQSEAEAREAAERETARRLARLAELSAEAPAMAAEPDLHEARTRFRGLREQWRTLAAGLSLDPAMAAAFADADAQMTAREQASHEADLRMRREALGRVNSLSTRVEGLLAKPDLSLKAADRALRDVRAALAAVPPLPTRQDAEDVTRRLKAAQTALTPRLQELREADDWRRFANASVQEQLCARMEALRATEDPEAAAREVRELQQQWRAAADVPRAQADSLWRRFKAAHDEVWSRCEAYFAAQSEVRAANLASKVALCDKAESLSESMHWIQTAEDIRALQAEWKTIGPASRGQEKAVWDRFRAACDRFFTRRHQDLASRKASWAENLARKDALSAQAEALAESIEWDRAAAEIKRLQAEWKTIGPVKKSKSDAVWARFRGACDRFFARYAQRHDTARVERIAAREALCTQMETLAGGEEMPGDLAATARALRGRWQQEGGSIGLGLPPDQAQALERRFAAAFDGVIARWPAAFAGSDLDPEANRARMEALVRRVEDLASSLGGPQAADDSLSPTNRLAAMLKEALAANTIGGKADEESRFRAAAEDVRQAQAAWSRIGLVPEDARRALSDRFRRAVRSITDRAEKVVGMAQPVGAGRSPQGARGGR